MKDAVDLVMGAVRGYDFEQLRPFINSLQRTGFSGDIVLLCNHLPEATRETLTKRGIRLQPMRYHAQGITNRWSRVWPFVAPVARRFEGSFATRQLFKAILPLLTTRFLHYRDFLSKHRGKYRNVLLTDIRDVVFQDDPLRGFPGGIEAYEETKCLPLKQQPQNAHWIDAMFGAPALERIGGHPVLCAGTIMGQSDALLELLAEYESLLCRVKRVDIYGSDQGVYNYLCRAVMPGKVRAVENGVGRVLTLGTINPGETEFRVDATGEILGANGRVAPVVHQFDRHPEIAARILEKFATPG